MDRPISWVKVVNGSDLLDILAKETREKWQFLAELACTKEKTLRYSFLETLSQLLLTRNERILLGEQRPTCRIGKEGDISLPPGFLHHVVPLQQFLSTELARHVENFGKIEAKSSTNWQKNCLNNCIRQQEIQKGSQNMCPLTHIQSQSGSQYFALQEH